MFATYIMDLRFVFLVFLLNSIGSIDSSPRLLAPVYDYAKIVGLNNRKCRRSQVLNNQWVEIIKYHPIENQCEVMLVRRKIKASVNATLLVMPFSKENLGKMHQLKKEIFQQQIQMILNEGCDSIVSFYGDRMKCGASASMHTEYTFSAFMDLSGTKYDNADFISLHSAQAVFIFNMIQDSMPKFQKKVWKLIHNERFTHPFFKQFMHERNWMLPQIIYAAESPLRRQIFAWMKSYDVNSLLGFAVQGGIVDHNFHMIGYFATFLYSIAIQKELNLSFMDHGPEFLELLNKDEIKLVLRRIESKHEVELELPLNGRITRYFGKSATDYFYDLMEHKHERAWRLDVFRDWCWTSEFHDYSKMTIEQGDSMNDIYQRITHRKVPASPKPAYNPHHALLFRALFVPIEIDEHKLSFTQNVQSFSLSATGMVPALRIHTELDTELLDPKKYQIVIMILPLHLLSWNQMASMHFAYMMIDPVVPHFEKEIILPPFSIFKWIQFKDWSGRCHNNINAQAARANPEGLSPSVMSGVVRKWGHQSLLSATSLFFNVVTAIDAIVAADFMPTQQEHVIQVRFVDMKRSEIADWKEWYLPVLGRNYRTNSMNVNFSKPS